MSITIPTCCILDLECLSNVCMQKFSTQLGAVGRWWNLVGDLMSLVVCV